MNNLILSSLENIFDNQGLIEVTIQKALLVLAISLVLGFVLSVVYIFTHHKVGYLSSMPTTLIILPVIITIVITTPRATITPTIKYLKSFWIDNSVSENLNNLPRISAILSDSSRS